MTKLEDKRTEIKRSYLKSYAKRMRPLDSFVPIDHPKLQQRAFLDSPKKNKTALGGNRSSKTVSGAVHVIEDCLNNAEHDWWDRRGRLRPCHCGCQ